MSKRRSNSVENPPEEDGFGGNRRMFKSASGQHIGMGSKGLKGKSSVLNRPGTIAALSALSLGGFSQNISASALRNAHPQWSFSKADRFNKLKIDNNAKMLVLPTTLTAKSSTFGFGNKAPLQMVFGKDSPPPTLYRTRSQFEFTPGAGKSFGAPHSVYKKVHMPGVNTRNDEIPGPGSYDSKSTLGMNSRKFSLKSRIKPADSATRDFPPPNTYNPTYTVAEEHKFEKITFGFGSRPNVTGRMNENPGPGTYRIPSVFDKFKRIPNASLLKKLEKYRKQQRRKIAKPQDSERSSKGLNIDAEEKSQPLAIEGEDNRPASQITKDGEIE